MTISRRAFLGSVGAATGAVAAGCAGVPAVGGRADGSGLLIVSTWRFAKSGNERAREVVLTGGSALDGVEQGIRVVETIGNRSVGLSGKPNAAGYVQQDACIMNGPDHAAGSVAAIEGIVHPISAARRVMEHSKHVMLVGEGARWFALEQGLESVDVSSHAAMKERWQTEHPPGRAETFPTEGHDTVAMLVRHPDGSIAGGCSTSGAGGKLPGRVGDSPILGSGLYVDNRVGAAGGTGLGENAMRHCATHSIVELMREGRSPTEACAEALHRMAEIDPRGYELSLSFCALDREGRWGAATIGNFACAVTTDTSSEVHKIEHLAHRR